MYQLRLVAPGGASGDLFGQSIVIYGDVVIVDSLWDEDLRENSGSSSTFL